ncbi:Carboxymuconolactone decarboxylase family protein [Candidatus Izimaplasma bacterium HR1]|jgi:AhpD family alkylhydroperoxidase|uniref:carboxymuconolactone decarboxylase family protein n=1 Tax=Candidatus Izimoplasma sp. HR1 TaxID=1541959 RepID=UPI0004F7ADEF|nr:Carboxymuconolactone decarboxylase family protein [Candidatus Izimaplasma bacterium HR1]
MSSHNSRVFKINEQIKNTYYGAKGFVLLRFSKRLKLMNKKFKERIMLATTEANGCSMCSYVHTKIALSSGMTNEDIKKILDGETSSVPVNEAVAVLYAQEFASSLGKPGEESTIRLINEYGFRKAELIVAACNMITMTNGMGISLHFLLDRLKFNRNKNSNILLEVLNPLITIVLFPLLTILFGLKSLIGFKPKTLKFNYSN